MEMYLWFSWNQQLELANGALKAFPVKGLSAREKKTCVEYNKLSIVHGMWINACFSFSILPFPFTYYIFFLFLFNWNQHGFFYHSIFLIPFIFHFQLEPAGL